ncbi:MAG: histidine phosphatase family protein [Thiotrichales bacterium]
MATRRRRHQYLSLIGLLIPIAGAGYALAQSPAQTWQAVQTGEAFVIIRHADAPGIGDPPEFQIEDCATQRNLSAKGRAQSRRIGAFIRSQGIERVQVLSSQWCRCLDTARLLELGPVEALPALNSFFEAPGRGPEQNAALHTFLTRSDRVGPTILVTHQVNITALTGRHAAAGEIIVFKPSADGPPEVLGRFNP